MNNKYEEFKARKIKTVAELIAKLQTLPQDAIVNSEGGDTGGYDTIGKNYCDIAYDDRRNTISISHMEYEMYHAMEKGEITREQYEELNEELNE